MRRWLSIGLFLLTPALTGCLGLGGDANTIAVFRDLQGLLFGGDNVIQDDLQLILGTQLEVIRGELGMRCQAPAKVPRSSMSRNRPCVTGLQLEQMAQPVP